PLVITNKIARSGVTKKLSIEYKKATKKSPTKTSAVTKEPAIEPDDLYIEYLEDLIKECDTLIKKLIK
ncbi:20397_t:CDS:2, partial [Gigaspora margarita]